MARWILGALLLAMAAGQLADVAGFTDIVAEYELGGGRSAATLIAAALITGELAGGFGLLSRRADRRRVAATVAVAVAVAWTLLAAQAFSRGVALDNCGCFGVYLGQPLRWWILLEDVEFIALGWWVLRSVQRPQTEERERDRRQPDDEDAHVTVAAHDPQQRNDDHRGHQQLDPDASVGAR